VAEQVETEEVAEDSETELGDGDDEQAPRQQQEWEALHTKEAEQTRIPIKEMGD